MFQTVKSYVVNARVDRCQSFCGANPIAYNVGRALRRLAAESRLLHYTHNAEAFSLPLSVGLGRLRVSWLMYGELLKDMSTHSVSWVPCTHRSPFG